MYYIQGRSSRSKKLYSSMIYIQGQQGYIVKATKDILSRSTRIFNQGNKGYTYIFKLTKDL